MASTVVSAMDKCPYDNSSLGESLKRKNIDEKRQLVHELSEDLDTAFDVLMKWGRVELLQVLCAELGEKENNTKLKKDQIINKLLKVVSEKNDSSTTTERNSKIQRKNTSSVKTKGSSKIRFEDVEATSLTLILSSEEGTSSEGNKIHYRIWYRKGSEKDYTEDMTCALVSPNTRCVVSRLTPATEYCFKVVSFRGIKETSFEETKVSTKTSQEDETISSAKEKQLALKETFPEKAVSVSNGGSSSNQGFEFEDCVGLLRQLELSGYVDTDFRLNFLTWYGLHANADKKNVVKGFVSNQLMINDPLALAKQLIHTFSDLI